MDHTFPSNAAHDDPSPARAPTPDRGRVESVEFLWDDLRGLARQLQLASQETRRAGESLVSVVLCGAIIGALAIIACLGVAAATALWLIGS